MALNTFRYDMTLDMLSPKKQGEIHKETQEAIKRQKPKSKRAQGRTERLNNKQIKPKEWKKITSKRRKRSG